MPNFEYTPFNGAPYAASVAELLAHSGDPAARAAVASAQAQARAREVSAAAWGGAAQRVGETIAAIPKQIAQQKVQQQQQKIGELDLEAKQRVSDVTKTLSSVMDETPKLSEDGVSVWDVPAITRAMTDRGFGAEAPAAAQHLDAINVSFRQARAAQLAVVKQGAQAVASAGNDPVLANHFLDQLEANQLAPATDIAKYREFIKADPANTAKLTAFLMGPQKMETAAPGSAARNPVTGQIVPGSQVPNKPIAVNGQLVQPDSGERIGEPIPKEPDPVAAKRLEETVRHNTEMERIDTLRVGREAARDAEMARFHRATEAQNDAAPALTPEGRDLVAKQFAMTGQLPPMGNGKAGAKVRTDVINRSAELYQGLDIATQKAAYEANRDSLKKLQVQRDAISAFEQTATKNIDIFLDTAGKVVDTGSPLANTLLRQASGKILGSSDQAAYDAARQVAVNEIAKITSNPNLSGTLSDSARHEIDAFNPQNATLAQSVKVMRLLKQDMANRASSMDDQIKAVQQRIAAPPGSAPSSAPKEGTTRQVGSETLTWKTVDGKTGWYK
jgi:hypothetical protein